jgi:hypothetical protein
MLRVLHAFVPFGPKPQDVPPWVRRWWSAPFHGSVRKFQDTMWKFDRVAGYVDQCRVAVQRWVEREARGDAERVTVSDSDWGAYRIALEDLPIHLDSMLLYLRIQADALAALVPYFYDRSGTISSRSFRDQRSWFTKTKPEFDPDYASILNHETAWFDELAGKNPTGLRDVIVHRGGTYQLGWTVPSKQDQFELQASLVNHRGFVEEDVLNALVGITEGWFRFLDSCCRHFVARLQSVVSWADISRDELSRYLSCRGSELPSFWVYPRATLN